MLVEQGFHARPLTICTSDTPAGHMDVSALSWSHGRLKNTAAAGESDFEGKIPGPER